MKLIRFGEAGEEKPGILDILANVKTFRSILKIGTVPFFKAVDGQIKKFVRTTIQIADVPKSALGHRSAPGKSDLHWIELFRSCGRIGHGHYQPNRSFFKKAAILLWGRMITLLIPRNSKKTDWEVELGMVIGKDARYLNSIDESKRLYCRLLHFARCVGARISTGARWPVDQRQILRHL